MSRKTALDRGRAAAEASMVDSCLIERAASSTMDANGVVTRTWSPIYRGRCRFQEQSGRTAAQIEKPGEAFVRLLHRELQLPVATSLGVRAEDRVTPTACVNDPDLVGRRHFVKSEAAGSEKTARRLGIEEVTS